MKYTKIIALFTIALLVWSCSTVNVSSDYDRNVNFQKYQTYNFHSKGLGELKMNDLDKRRLIRAIENQLQNRGFKLSQHPDVILNIATATKEQINVNQSSWGFGWGGYGWNMGWNMPLNTSSRTVGSIVIDMVDAHKNILVWQAKGTGLNVESMNNREERIAKAVAEMFDKYPLKLAK